MNAVCSYIRLKRGGWVIDSSLTSPLEVALYIIAAENGSEEAMSKIE